MLWCSPQHNNALNNPDAVMQSRCGRNGRRAGSAVGKICTGSTVHTGIAALTPMRRRASAKQDGAFREYLLGGINATVSGKDLEMIRARCENCPAAVASFCGELRERANSALEEQR